MINNIEKILLMFDEQQLNRLKYFLISEIDDDVLKETIKFVISDDKEKEEKFQDILYDGEKYEGLFLEGNQYLISSCEKNVLLIDSLSEEQGVNEENTRLVMNIDNFICLISDKKEVLNWIESNDLLF
jgi:hypothetical protein